MTIYIDSAFNPRFVASGHPTFVFNDDPKASVESLSVGHGRRVSNHVIPGTDGQVIIGSQKDGLTIDLTLQISSDDLEGYTGRKNALESILEGGDEAKFDFYLRFVDSDNFWRYSNCVLLNKTMLEGAQDPVNPAIVAKATVVLQIVSADSTPTIKSNGVVEEGDETLTQTGESLTAIRFLISDELIVQNEFGVIMCKISAATGRFEIVGTLTQTL